MIWQEKACYYRSLQKDTIQKHFSQDSHNIDNNSTIVIVSMRERSNSKPKNFVFGLSRKGAYDQRRQTMRQQFREARNTRNKTQNRPKRLDQEVQDLKQEMAALKSEMKQLRDQQQFRLFDLHRTISSQTSKVIQETKDTLLKQIDHQQADKLRTLKQEMEQQCKMTIQRQTDSLVSQLRVTEGQIAKLWTTLDGLSRNMDESLMAEGYRDVFKWGDRPGEGTMRLIEVLNELRMVQPFRHNPHDKNLKSTMSGKQGGAIKNTVLKVEREYQHSPFVGSRCILRRTTFLIKVKSICITNALVLGVSTKAGMAPTQRDTKEYVNFCCMDGSVYMGGVGRMVEEVDCKAGSEWTMVVDPSSGWVEWKLDGRFLSRSDIPHAMIRKGLYLKVHVSHTTDKIEISTI